jgi:ATPase subunit of ABC transporter with duplicated ATPase domains
MIETQNLTLSFAGSILFEDVNVKFVSENCYGLIGANGAGKSTFLKILSGEIEPTKGDVVIEKGKRISVLRQDQFAFDEVKVLDAVLMGHKKLYEVYAERTRLYAKPDLSDDEGMRVSDLEVQYAEMDGYTIESDAATMLSDLGITVDLHDRLMKEIDAGLKIRVLLAQALFGNPDILLLDEPTNQLDYEAVQWLENFLMEFKNTVIVVSHDRHFLNKVCTHIADLDFKQIRIYVGNYDFWSQSSKMAMAQKQEQHKKSTDKIKELEEFIRRFSANASKSKQATSRKKLIDKIRPEELPVSTRKTPFIQFKPGRPCGNSILHVKNISHSIGGEKLLNDVTFSLNKNDKLAILAKNPLAKTTLLQIIAGEITPDSGTIEWGETITKAYAPKDNATFFKNDLTLLDWITQFRTTEDNQTLRGYLGRMLFSGDDVTKKVKVLSGGEKARAMFSKMMLNLANVLIFDEPTDHLDLEAITSLNDGLKAFPECIIFTSHDFELTNTVANRIIEISPDKKMRDKHTTFEDFIGRKAAVY